MERTVFGERNGRALCFRFVCFKEINMKNQLSAIRELNVTEIYAVSGGLSIGDVIAIAQVAIAAASAVSKLDQGGTPNGTDAMGNNW